MTLRYLVLAIAAPTLTPLAQSKYQPRVRSDGFGQRVACLGDVDNDGVADFAIAAPTDDGRRGAIYAVSGATRKAIYVVHGLDGVQHLGSNLQSGGDVDGDGVLDLLVANTRMAWNDKPAENVVKVISGKDGRCIRSNSAKGSERWSFGSARILGDVQGDCHAEYAIGTDPSDDDECSYAIVFDGKSGMELARTPVDAPRDVIVSSIAWFRDPMWNDDMQLAIGTVATRFVAPRRPVEIRFAKTGALRSVVRALVPHEARFSGQVHTIGDVDGDGVRDLVLSSARCSSHAVPDLEVVSARTGERLWSLQLAEFAPTPDDSIALGAECVVPCLDIDGDRMPDVIVSNHDAGACGMVWALSGKTGRRIYAIHGELGNLFGISIAVSDSFDHLVPSRHVSSRCAPNTPRFLVVGCRPSWIGPIPSGVDGRSHVSIHSLESGQLIALLRSDELRDAR